MPSPDDLLEYTHDVINQPMPLQDFNLFQNDQVLRQAVIREGLNGQ